MAPSCCQGLIRRYFHLGLSYNEIISVLMSKHNVFISKRTLKRRLLKMGLFRRKHHSDLLDVACFIENEIQTSGQLHGYRWMHLRCKQNGINVDKETVRIVLGYLDPEGVELRRRKRLQRRTYRVPGPNYIWHIDSYDKLKPYGICINGCIDGFSRNVIWLDAYTTSSDPKVIAGYYMDAIQKKMGCPKFIRTDLGTENTVVGQLQQFLSGDDRGFMQGTSQHNQRIECWWSMLRKHCSQFWMSLFQKLKDDGNFSGDYLDKSLIQFCFMKLIQDDMNTVVKEWNAHRITPSRNRHGPFGRPLMMYTVPHLFEGRDFLVPVENDEVQLCNSECRFKSQFPCDEDVFELCTIFMEENQLSVSANCEEGICLYNFLRDVIMQEMN